MIEIVFRSFAQKLDNCEFYITILRLHDLNFEASNILRQVAEANNITLNIMIVDEVTNGPAETVYKTLINYGITGPFLIKDSDNVVDFDPAILNFNNTDGFLVGGDIARHNIADVHQKSFIIADTNSRVTNFVEKRVVSNVVCFGLYGFSSAEFFVEYFDKIVSMKFNSEIFVSHVVQSALVNNRVFYYREALSLADWGIWSQWMLERKRLRSFFVDFDGVLVRNTGHYGTQNWDSEFQPLENNMAILKSLSDSGSQIILTTSRPQRYQKRLEELFIKYKINIYSYIFGLNHSERIVLNDYSDTNPYPSASALNLPRDGDLNTLSDVL